jgi:hypothetical protein
MQPVCFWPSAMQSLWNQSELIFFFFWQFEYVPKFVHVISFVQWNLWIATLRNEDILWNKDTSSGPKLLFSVQIALWNEDTSE